MRQSSSPKFGSHLTRILILLGLFTLLVPAYGQLRQNEWKPSTYQAQRTVIADLLDSTGLGTWRYGFTFFGPDFGFEENVLDRGLDISEYAGQNNWQWSSVVKTDTVTKTSTCFYINCFVQNVRSYQVWIEDESGEKFIYNNEVNEQGYQVPSELNINSFRSVTGDRVLPEQFRIARWAIRFEPQNQDVSTKFVLGELKIFNRAILQVAAKGMLFYELTGDPAYRQTQYTYENFGTSLPLKRFSIYRDPFAQSIWFEKGGVKSDSALQQQTLDLVKYIISKYPYYGEHGASKAQIQQSVDHLIDSACSFEAKLLCLQKLVSLFYDGHFQLRFKETANRLSSGPVLIKELNHRIFVVGILNDQLYRDVSLGDEVLAVDGLNISEKIAAYEGSLIGNENSRRSQAISRLLYKQKEDSATLLIRHNGQLRQIVYSYSLPLQIPSSFRPVHGSLKKFDSIIYYRLNRWTYGDWVHFFNHREELQKSKTIILDLRGNTGGAESEAFKFISTFINRPVTVSYSVFHSDLSGQVLLDSNVVRPNSFLNLSDHKLIVLVDNATACASEMFTSVVKYRSRAVVIGSEPTMGSYASAEELHLPFDVTLQADIFTKFIPVNESMGIEFTGVRPDVPVTLKSYRDLYPYEDKVLKTALDYAGRKK
jgi:C-terminal processing protease CtpA/Prc